MSTTKIDDLTPVAQDKVKEGIPAASQAEAREQLANAARPVEQERPALLPDAAGHNRAAGCPAVRTGRPCPRDGSRQFSWPRSRLASPSGSAPAADRDRLANSGADH